MEQINKASWRNLVLIVVMILGLSLVPKQSPAADKLRIGYGAPTVSMAPLWISQEGTLFGRNGLDVAAGREVVCRGNSPDENQPGPRKKGD